MSVFHPETTGDRAELHETKPFIKMPGMDVALHDGIELEDTEAELLCFLQTISHQLFADMLSAHGRGNSIARIADMPAASHVIRMQDVQSDDLSVRIRHTGIALGGKEGFSAFRIQSYFLRKRDPFLNDFIPDPDHLFQIRRCMFSDQHGRSPFIRYDGTDKSKRNYPAFFETSASHAGSAARGFFFQLFIPSSSSGLFS